MAVSNSDILKEVKVLKDNMASFDKRLKPLEDWKIAFDAADAALTKYKKENVPVPQAPGLTRIDKEFLKLVARLITLMTSALGIIYLLVQQLNH